MILHLALFTWKEDVTADDVAELTSQLREMASQVPALRRYDCGENLRLRPSDADFAVAAVVDDAAGLSAYLDSDAHHAVYDRRLGRMIAQRQAAQLEIGEDAAL
jgi:Stress responsive A/B Barrel Domain